MSIKRVVNTEFWTDKKVVEQFTPEDKYFFLYMLTNPHTTQLGIYQFVYKVAAFETGYNTDTITNLIDRFVKFGVMRVSQFSGEIAIKNFLKHSIIKGGDPVFDLLTKEARAVKDVSLLQFVLEANRNSTNETVKKFVTTELKRFTNEKDNQADNDNGCEIDNVNDTFNDIKNEDSYYESSKGLAEERFDLGPMGYVKLSGDEYIKLVADLGQDEVDRVIACVDERAKITDNKNGWKDWYIVLRRASREKWGIK
jgi:hypothetical protein